MKYFDLEIFHGHPIISDGRNVMLIDTGAPSSIHTSGTLNFLSGTYSCSTNYMGLTTEKLSDLLGKKVSTLLGTDILRNYSILMDYQKSIVAFDDAVSAFEGEEVTLSSFMGIPIIELTLHDMKQKFYLDTGAKLSYLPSDNTKDLSPVSLVKDFYPGFGEFETNTYELEVRIGSSKFLAQFGNLPPLLQMTLALGNVQGIIGYDFFKQFRVLLDLSNNSMRYELAS